jgi:hypothetical protein
LRIRTWLREKHERRWPECPNMAIIQLVKETPKLATTYLVKTLSKSFGNTLTSTLWRFAEEAHGGRPMVALVTGHPHPTKRKIGFDPAVPCRYCVESPPFRERFGTITEPQLFELIVSYSGAQRGGSLGQDEVLLLDRNGNGHIFAFETFFNGHEALTLGYWMRPQVASRFVSNT